MTARDDVLAELDAMRSRLEDDAIDDERRELIHELRNVAAVVSALPEGDEACADTLERVEQLRAKFRAWAEQKGTTP